MRHLTNNIAEIIIINTLAITLMAITMSVLAEMLLSGTNPLPLFDAPPVGVTFGNGCQSVTPAKGVCHRILRNGNFGCVPHKNPYHMAWVNVLMW